MNTRPGMEWVLNRIRLPHGGRPRADRDHREGGATSLEYTGALAIAGAVIVVLLSAFTLQSVGIGQRAAYGACKMVTVGGECGSPGGPGALEHERAKSPQVCVLSNNAVSSNREVAVVHVTARSGRPFEVAQLSDGTYQVTEAAPRGAGGPAGHRAGVSITVPHNRTGDDGAELDFHPGEVFFVNDTDELDQMINQEAEDTIEDGVVGDGPGRWLWNGAQKLSGVANGTKNHEFGTPDEVYAEGGVVINASAEATAVVNVAAAKPAQSEGLGVRTTKTGQTTVYLRTTAEGSADLQRLGIDTTDLDLSEGGRPNRLQLLTSVTFDNSGNMIEVGTEATGAGQSQAVVARLFHDSSDDPLSDSTAGVTMYQAKLPVKTGQDRNIALSFLATSGVSGLGRPGRPGSSLSPLTTSLPGSSGMSDFRQAAADHGTITQQQLPTETGTPLAIKTAVKIGHDLGVTADVSTTELASNGGQYWDGTSWQTWTDCSGS